MEFRTFGEWADNGIDVLCTTEGKSIICQCKRYNPNNFNSLKQSLKKEVKKCKKQNSERYILFSSVILGEDQFEVIVDLFEGYLKQSDIIDAEKLSEFLKDEENYGQPHKPPQFIASTVIDKQNRPHSDTKTLIMTIYYVTP